MQDIILRDYQNNINRQTYEYFSENFSQSEIENALVSYYVGAYGGYPIDDVRYLKAFNNRLIDFIDKTTRDEADKADLIHSAIGMCHYSYLMKAWQKSRQSFVFNKDMVSELSKTDTTFKIPYNIFDRLPFTTLYLDFSANKELCEKIEMDGFLLKIIKVNAAFERHEEAVKDNDYWVLLGAIYRNGRNTFVRGNVLLNKKTDDEVTLNELTADVLNLQKDCNFDIKTQTVLITQALLYLSSYEPDIRETTDSKSKKASYKRNKKKGKKLDKPEGTYIVGERFGAAFRKWTADSTGKESSTPNGKHVKPHFRRAHWHRYWIGKKNSNDRKLVVKWVHQCLCGANNTDELDFVKHKVN